MCEGVFVVNYIYHLYKSINAFALIKFSLFDEVECDNFSKIDKKKLNQASTIVFSPGPGSPKDYPLTSKIYKNTKEKKE